VAAAALSHDCVSSIAERNMQFIQFIVVVCVAYLANLAGAAFARRVRDRRHLARSFSAGTVIAVAFFIFLPQALMRSDGAHSADQLLPLVGLGFVIALLLDRFGPIAFPGSDKHASARKHYGHAVLNGAAIGIAYHVSPTLSAVVSAALLVHEFSDSADAESLTSGGPPRSVRRASSVRGACVAAGLAVTYFSGVSPQVLCIALAMFGGYFAYLSASDLIPESYHEHPQLLTVAMTFGGAGAMYVLASLS
jgi:zinc transporter ZupT